jgi:hypothetical protein
MQQLHIELDDWQREVLSELAEARGVGVETMAKSLLSERLVERMHTAFDDLLSGEPILGGYDLPGSETIEQRLGKLFEA